MRINHEVLGPIVLRQVAEGVYLDEENRYHPYPATDGMFVNAPGPSFGVAKTGDLYRLIVQFGVKNAAQPYARNVFYYILNGITGSPSFAKVATELLKQWFAALSNSTSTPGLSLLYGPTYAWQRPEVESLVESTDSLQGANSQAGIHVDPTGAVPLRSSIVFHKGTAKRGRSFNGRTFFAAPDEGAQAAGRLTGDGPTNAQATATKQLELDISAINSGAKATQAVYSAKESKAQKANVATPMTSYTARAVLGSQRRRQDVT